MIDMIQQFASCCRAAGLRISTSEVLDCFRHLQLIDISDEMQFKTTLRTNFIKNYREQGKFDQLYHLFFHELRTDIEIARSTPLGSLVKDVLENLDQNSVDNPSKSILDFLSGDPIGFLEEVRSIQSEGNEPMQGPIKGPRSNLGSLARRLKIMLQIYAVQESIMNFLAENKSKFSWETNKNLKTYFSQRLDRARRYLHEDPPAYPDNSSHVTSYEKYLTQIGERNFASLTPKEVDEMRIVIAHWVRKLKDTIGLRYSRNNRGIIDVKQTLRDTMKYYGVPLKISYRKRPKRKGKIVTLCDVSGSVWSAARFMLNMLYSLQECFAKVRSFVFVADMDEVTRIFENNDINEAIDKALKEAKISYNADTDYGSAFRNFKRSYMDALNKKTTLIIIGDGRSNYTNPEEDIFDEMREKCRRVVWLNPEPKVFWYTGDSEMRTYEVYCHQLRVCGNLNQLMDFINDLVL
ncbi:MAG: VWA domain-containing protein [Desulfobacterales bacterium]|nr:VWA domain-containing protein [Desulfobacterales bacterium]